MFQNAWKVGKIGGIQILIDPSWLFVFALIAYTLTAYYFPLGNPHWPRSWHIAAGCVTAVLFFASVLGHELTHSLVAIRQGHKVGGITLFVFGGVAQIQDEPKGPGQEFLIAVVGPISSLLIALLFYVVNAAFGLASEMIRAISTYLIFLNVALAVFNSLPGYPMDGGRVLRSIVWKITGSIHKATRAASAVGRLVAFLIILLGLARFLGVLGPPSLIGGLWLVFIGWFLYSAAAGSYQQMQMSERLSAIRAREIMSRDIAVVPPNMAVQELIEEYFLHGRGRVFVVVENEELAGIVSLEDVARVPRDQRPYRMLREVMIPAERLHSTSPDADGMEVLNLMQRYDVSQIPVLEGKEIRGVVRRRDIIQAIQIRERLGM